MIRTTLLIPTLALACCAQDGKELQLTANLFASSRQGDLATERGGGGELGLNLETRFRFSPTGALRLRWELPSSTRTVTERCFTPGYTETRETRTWGLGLDYVHDFRPRKEDGFFVSAGLALQGWKASYRGAEASGSFAAQRTYDSRNLGLSAGVGYRFWRMHAELRAVTGGFQGREAVVRGGQVTGWRDADKRGTTFQLVVGLR